MRRLVAYFPIILLYNNLINLFPEMAGSFCDINRLLQQDEAAERKIE
jgi:hypothetical protein